MRKYLIGISAAAILALAAGCGGDAGDTGDAGGGTVPDDKASSQAPAGDDASAEHNEQDMTFAQMMIPHHQQAIDMTKLAAEKATDAKVKDLATRIEDAQDPEIEKMNGMLEQWGAAMGEDMPGMDHGSDHGSDHGGTSMPGMMTEQEMSKLEKATGATFDKMWVQMMIRHHQGAIDMANTELKSGKNADAKALAQQIIDAQQAEIDEMRGMLS
jgi:uncharacterized protein (DUF305 family)